MAAERRHDGRNYYFYKGFQRRSPRILIVTLTVVRRRVEQLEGSKKAYTLQKHLTASSGCLASPCRILGHRGTEKGVSVVLLINGIYNQVTMSFCVNGAIGKPYKYMLDRRRRLSYQWMSVCTKGVQTRALAQIATSTPSKIRMISISDHS